jgi:hypothetical protein
VTSDSFKTTTGTASFDALTDGRARAAGAAVTVQRLPWSDNSVIWLGGKDARTISLTLWVESDAEFDTLESLVGESGTLAWAEGTLATVLMDTSSGEILPWGGQKVRARFTVAE